MSSRELKLKVLFDTVDKLTGPLRRIAGGGSQAARQMKTTIEQLKKLNATQKNVSGFRDMQGALRRSGAELSGAQRKVTELAQSYRAAAIPTAALTRSFTEAKREASQLKARYQQQRAELEGLRRKLGEAKIGTRDLSAHERTLRNQIERTNLSLDRQKRRLAASAAARSRYDRTKAFAGNAAMTGAVSGAAGVGVFASMRSAMMPGVDFDAGMSNVQALTRLDKQSDELRQLRQQARDLGASTTFTATDAAAGQGFLAMAGFKPKQIQAAMPGMLDMARAGGTELGQTADIGSNILTGMGLDASEMGRIGDVLVGTFTRSNTNLQMLGETMKYAAPVARMYGVSIETAAAMAGKLGDAGVQSSMGGTALAAIMNRLAAPPKQAAAALDELGIKTQDAKGNLRELPDILSELYQRTKGMGSAVRGGLLKAIAGEEAVKGLATLVDQAGTGKLQEFIATLKSSQGEAATVAERMTDNLRGDVAGLSSAWEDFGIELFDGNNGAIRHFVIALTEVVRSINVWAKANPALASTLVRVLAACGALALGVGALGLTVGVVARGFGALQYAAALTWRYGLQPLGVAARSTGMAMQFAGRASKAMARALLMNPIGLIVAGIAAAAFLVYRYWGPIKAFFGGLFGGLMQGLAPLAPLFTGTFGAIGALLSPLKPLWDGLVGALAAAWGWVSRLAAPFHATGEQLRGATGAGQAFGRWLGWLVSTVATLPLTLYRAGADLVRGLVSGIGDMLPQAYAKVAELAEGLKAKFKNWLGIQSPSRVFMGYGAHIADGAALGIEGRRSAVTRASLGLASAAALAFAPGAVQAKFQPAGDAAFDSRAPLSTARTAPALGGDTIHITIHPAAGTDTAALARLVAQELDKRDRAKAARSRSSLSDRL